MKRPGVLTSRGQAFLGVGLSATLAGMVLGYPDITRIGLLLVVLPFLTMLLATRRPPRIRVTRMVTPTRLLPEERGEVEVHFVNMDSRRTPMFLAEEQFDYALGDRPRFLLPRMSRGEQRRLHYSVRSRHRGAYQLGPVTLRLRDPFGLTHVAMHLAATSEVLVLPRVYDLASRGTRGQGRGTEGDLPHMVALHGEDDVSIRQYRDGDELRRVHWPATAHRGELMVRQEDRPTRRRAVLLLDSRAGSHPGSGFHPSYEWAVSALASVARHLLADGFVVHLLTDSTLRSGSAAYPVELDELMAELARVQPEPGTSLAALSSAAHTFTTTGVQLIAALVADDEEELRGLSGVREPGSTAAAFVLDPQAFRGRTEGDDRRTADRVALPLHEAGWQTVTVGPSTSVASAWEQIRSARTLSRPA